MPKPRAENQHAKHVEALLRERPGLDHLRTRHRADLVTIESGPDDEPIPHARLRRDTVHLWRLEMATHRGTWEPTPVRSSLDDAVGTLVEAFGWTLSPRE